MKEIFYISKEFKKTCILIGLDFYKQLSLGAHISIYRYYVEIELLVLCFEFVFGFGIIRDYKDD